LQPLQPPRRKTLEAAAKGWRKETEQVRRGKGKKKTEKQKKREKSGRKKHLKGVGRKRENAEAH